MYRLLITPTCSRHRHDQNIIVKSSNIGKREKIKLLLELFIHSLPLQRARVFSMMYALWKPWLVEWWYQWYQFKRTSGLCLGEAMVMIIIHLCVMFYVLLSNCEVLCWQNEENKSNLKFQHGVWFVFKRPLSQGNIASFYFIFFVFDSCYVMCLMSMQKQDWSLHFSHLPDNVSENELHSQTNKPSDL